MTRYVVVLVPLMLLAGVVVLALDIFGVRTWLTEWAAYTLLEQVGLN